MTLDYKWAIGIGTVLLAIVVSAALLMAQNNAQNRAIRESQECTIALLLVEPEERTLDTVVERCPEGSIPEREPE